MSAMKARALCLGLLLAWPLGAAWAQSDTVRDTGRHVGRDGERLKAMQGQQAPKVGAAPTVAQRNAKVPEAAAATAEPTPSAPHAEPEPVLAPEPVVQPKRPPAAAPMAPAVAQPVLPKFNVPVLQDGGPSMRTLAEQPSHEPGQLILAWAGEGAVPWGEWAGVAGGVLRAQTKLDALGLSVAVMQFGSDAQAREAAVSLARDRPGLVVDVHARAYAQQAAAAPPEATSEPAARQYAAAMVLGDGPGAGLKEGQAPARCAAKVGIIDTGLLPGSAASRLSAGQVLEKRFISPMDKAASAEHGTAVATVIAGQTLSEGPGRGFRSVAPGVDLYQASVMWQAQGFATTHTLALGLALNWLSGMPVDVINMSLATPGDRVLALLIERTLAKGIVIVAAVGPGSSAPALIYPAAYPGVLAVGAVDAALNPAAQALRAPYVGISAPGVEVWLPVPHPKEPGLGGAYYTGSSFAAPWVTGVVAQLKARGLVQSPLAALATLCATARAWSQPSPTGLGCGVLAWSPHKGGVAAR